MEEKIVAVLDTDVLFGFESRRHLLAAAENEAFVGVWSPYIVEELARNLTFYRIKSAGTSSVVRRNLSVQAQRMMDFMTEILKIDATAPPHPKGWEGSDSGDLHLLTTAENVKATLIVSNNTRDFPPPDANGRYIWRNTEYLTAREFLERIGFDEEG